MAWQRGEPAPAQLDPDELDRDDSWNWTCGVCGLCVQGGRGGQGTHMATVHPEAL